MIKSLIWEEWHEQRWRLALGTIMTVYPLFGQEQRVRDFFSKVRILSFFCLNIRSGSYML